MRARSRRKLRSSPRRKTFSRPTRGGGGPAWKRSLPGTISSRNASSAWTMRRSTRSSGPCPRSAFNGFRRRASSMRFATGTPRSSKPSTAYCETPSYPNHTALVLRKIFSALERHLNLAVDLLESEGDLGRDGMNPAIHADRFQALQKFHVESGLRGGGLLEEGLVQGKRVDGPLHDSFEFWLREQVRLAQDVDEGQAVTELDRGVEEDGRDEATRISYQRRVIQVDERGILPAEGIDQDGAGGPEREQLDLARGVDQDVVRLERLEDIREFFRIHGDHVGRGDLRSVGSESLLRHDFLDVHVVPDIEIGRVLKRLGSRVEVHGDAVEALGVHPQLEREDHRGLPRSHGPEEVEVSSHVPPA